MILTFIIDPPTLLLFGGIFARLNTTRLSGNADLIASRWFFRGIVFTTVFVGAALWSYARSPDWMWMYFTEKGRLSLLDILYLLIFLYYIPYVLGYILGIWAEQKKKNLSLLVIGVAAFFNVYIIAATFSRYRVVGTVEEFRTGTAASLFGPNPVSLPMNMASIALVLLGVYYIVRFVQERRAESRGLTAGS